MILNVSPHDNGDIKRTWHWLGYINAVRGLGSPLRLFS